MYLFASFIDFLCAGDYQLQDVNYAQMIGGLESKIRTSAGINNRPIELSRYAIESEKDVESGRRCARQGRMFYGKLSLKKCGRVCCTRCWFQGEHPTSYSCGKK